MNTIAVSNKRIGHKSPARRLEVAMRRLDRRYCIRMMIYLLIPICALSGVLIGLMVMLLIGNIKVIIN